MRNTQKLFIGTALIVSSFASLADINFRIVSMSLDSPPFDYCQNDTLIPGAIGLDYLSNNGYQTLSTAPLVQRYPHGFGCLDDFLLNINQLPAEAPPTITAGPIGKFETLTHFNPDTDFPKVGPPALILIDDNTPAAAGTVKLRFVNVLVDSTGNANLQLDGQQVASSTAFTEQTVFPGLPYEVVTHKPGNYSVDILNDDGETLAVMEIALEDQGVYTMWVSGKAGAQPSIDVSLAHDNVNNGAFVPAAVLISSGSGTSSVSSSSGGLGALTLIALLCGLVLRLGVRKP
ncbi:MAG: hypothetical protein ACI9LE_002069 [Paraglaciecola sp.]|jgi:hypothetical protein